MIADRKRIEQENQRKLDEYQALVKKGQENVKELNARFGDWFPLLLSLMLLSVAVRTEFLDRRRTFR